MIALSLPYGHTLPSAFRAPPTRHRSRRAPPLAESPLSIPASLAALSFVSVRSRWTFLHFSCSCQIWLHLVEALAVLSASFLKNAISAHIRIYRLAHRHVIPVVGRGRRGRDRDFNSIFSPASLGQRKDLETPFLSSKLVFTITTF